MGKPRSGAWEPHPRCEAGVWQAARAEAREECTCLPLGSQALAGGKSAPVLCRTQVCTDR